MSIRFQYLLDLLDNLPSLPVRDKFKKIEPGFITYVITPTYVYRQSRVKINVKLHKCGPSVQAVLVGPCFRGVRVLENGL